jgi:hypothetical protein
MVAFFVGGAAMSAIASLTYSAAGWAGGSALGAFTAATALGFWLRVRNVDGPPPVATGHDQAL